MGFDFDRWLKYAKARIDTAIGSGNRRLDEMEAEREAERADMPWLTNDDSDAVAPSMDQVRARIEWEAERQGVDAPTGAKGDGGVPDRPDDPPAARSPQERDEDAEREMARLALEARQKASAERLDEIRKELGVEPPTDDTGADGRG